MPRSARRVFAGIPHHVTQRGNRKEDIFFQNGDRAIYLKWLTEYCEKHQVEIVAYCLMSNHVHLVVVPFSAEGLYLTLQPLHTRYALYLNKKSGLSGRVWQGRFFSSPMDENYAMSAIKYVELNPVRAGLVSKAEDYIWSSAAPHCGLRKDTVLISNGCWGKKLQAIDSWSNWLASGISKETENTLRKNTRKDLPCGSPVFIKALESICGESFEIKPRGRPRKIEHFNDC